MVLSLAPLASLSLLTEPNKTTGRRSLLTLPMANTRTFSLFPSAPFFFPSSSFFEMKLWSKYRTLQKVSSHGVRVPKRTFMVVRASLETDGSDASGAELPPLQVSDKPVSVESLPLESKQQMLLEQKLRMKLAKKIRLRRKRLLRKRRMRKKGRWPPSKMKKNKNV